MVCLSPFLIWPVSLASIESAPDDHRRDDHDHRAADALVGVERLAHNEEQPQRRPQRGARVQVLVQVLSDMGCAALPTTPELSQGYYL